MTCCPTCGLPTEALVRQTSRSLNRTQTRLLHLVRSAGSCGITTEALRERLLGPNCFDSNLIAVYVCTINKHLAPQGYRIVCRPRAGRNAMRYLEKLPSPLDEKVERT